MTPPGRSSATDLAGSALSTYGEEVCLETSDSFIGSQERTLFLKQETQDPVVGAIKLSQPTTTLKDAFFKLSALAKKLEQPQPVAVIGRKSAHHLAVSTTRQLGSIGKLLRYSRPMLVSQALIRNLPKACD